MPPRRVYKIGGPALEDQALIAPLAKEVASPEVFNFRLDQGDLLIWEDIGTIHNAIPDYRADEPRLIKRCQVMATRFRVTA